MNIALILAAVALVPQPAKLVETGGAAPASAEVRYVEDASVPAEGYRFSHWSDNNTDNPRHFTVSGAVTLTAHFTASAQGVHTPDKSVAVDIYPNPTTGFITLSQFAERVEVLDTWGRIVAVAENVINMDLSDLADGTYTLRISTQGTVVLKKVVKR